MHGRLVKVRDKRRPILPAVLPLAWFTIDIFLWSRAVTQRLPCGSPPESLSVEPHPACGGSPRLNVLTTMSATSGLRCRTSSCFVSLATINVDVISMGTVVVGLKSSPLILAPRRRTRERIEGFILALQLKLFLAYMLGLTTKNVL